MLFHGVDDCVDGGDNHFTHLTQAVDCCLKSRKDVKSTDEKEDDDGVDEYVDGCFDNCFGGCVDSH
eukprot:10080737-Ditylum_brightwellii.AAC.1